MAWTKIPKEHHPLFHAAMPADKRAQAIQMFGGVAGKVNGNMFGGLFARSFMVKLSTDDHAEALKLDGAEPFDPMGNGVVMSNSVLMPEELLHDPTELRSWLRRAFDYVSTLPKKSKKAAKKPTAKKPTGKTVAPRKAKKKPAPKKARPAPKRAKAAKKPRKR
jgi:TfoX/Sxy family transcriptional regulator of competence genes